MTTWIVALVAATVYGCAGYTEPVGPPPRLTTARRNFQNVWDASLTVLGRYDFTIDRKDVRAGLITTLPQTGKHFFEFWRHDTATRRDLAENSLHTIYRSATVRIRPTSPGAETFTADVTVEVTRSDLPSAQVSSTSEAYSLFILPSDEGRRMFLLDYGRDEQRCFGKKSAWIVPLGRDRNLEDTLTCRIKAAAAQNIQ
ncbi:MAG: hypothetical protein SVT52_08930 [Planctomycetota bacterium]|nr:hypothetical protein [Planctomycetota bacterium]